MTGLVRVHRAIFCLRSVALQSKITFLGGSTGRYFAFGKNLGGPLRTPTHPYAFATLPASLLRRGLPRPAEPCRPVSPSPASRRASYDSTPASAGLLRLIAHGSWLVALQIVFTETNSAPAPPSFSGVHRGSGPLPGSSRSKTGTPGRAAGILPAPPVGTRWHNSTGRNGGRCCRPRCHSPGNRRTPPGPLCASAPAAFCQWPARNR